MELSRWNSSPSNITFLMSLLQHPMDTVYKGIVLKREEVWTEKDRGVMYLRRRAHQQGAPGKKGILVGLGLEVRLEAVVRRQWPSEWPQYPQQETIPSFGRKRLPSSQGLPWEGNNGEGLNSSWAAPYCRSLPCLTRICSLLLRSPHPGLPPLLLPGSAPSR